MKDENDKFYTIGYYIRKIEDKPAWLDIRSDKIISVSPCFTDEHPPIDIVLKAAGWTVNIDLAEKSKEYCKKYGFTEEEFSQMLEDAYKLFDAGLMFGNDSRFKNKASAAWFYKKYYEEKGFMPVGIATKQKYADILKEDMYIEQEPDLGELLGCDILGYDMSAFHTFLCNSLQEETKTAKFNKYGLLENTFEEIESMAEQIDGMGEPVDWLPFKLNVIR